MYIYTHTYIYSYIHILTHTQEQLIQRNNSAEIITIHANFMMGTESEKKSSIHTYIHTYS